MVGASQTLAVLRVYLARDAGSGARRLLEVGCGRGEVAAGLGKLGWEVVAIDTDAEAVAVALARGVDARVRRFPPAADPSAPDPVSRDPVLLEPALTDPSAYDAILFVRVLHHVPLAPCLDAVARLLRPGGLLAVEDYDWERVDRATASWAFELMAPWVAAPDASPALRAEWTGGEDPLARWRGLFEAERIHGGEAMRRELERRFEPVHAEPAPYFYRYLAKHLPGPDAAEHTSRALEAERAAIEAGRIRPLGQRFVVRRP